MGGAQFIKHLTDKFPDSDIKLECLNFYIKTFPVKVPLWIKSRGVFLNTGQKTISKLQDVEITEGEAYQINEAFDKLVLRVDELNEYIINNNL